MVNCKFCKDKQCVNYKMDREICIELYDPNLRCPYKQRRDLDKVKKRVEDPRENFYRITKEELLEKCIKK